MTERQQKIYDAYCRIPPTAAINSAAVARNVSEVAGFEVTTDDIDDMIDAYVGSQNANDHN